MNLNAILVAVMVLLCTVALAAIIGMLIMVLQGV